ncbi:MAG: helix-turn-helix domain-containing protein [Marmoricola sp.]
MAPANTATPAGGFHFETHDPEAAERFLNRVHAGAPIRISGDLRDFRLTASRTLDGGRFKLDEFALTAATTFVYTPTDEVVVSRLDYGDLRHVYPDWIEARPGAGEIVLAAIPDTLIEAHVNALRQRAVRLEQAALDEVAVQDPDGEPVPVRFTDPRPRSAAHARRWWQTVETVRDLFGDSHACASPLIRGPAGRLVASVTLAAFPNTAVTEAGRHDGADATPATLRRAVAYIETNSDHDIKLIDIARAAYVTPRAVQLAFRRHLDTTPTAYVRRVRLRHARRQLQEAAPDDKISVTSTALDWGFANPSRFAQNYRAAYGEAPSATLRRPLSG